MERRRFLTSAAALLPASSLAAFASNDGATAADPVQLHVVLNGEDRLGESHPRGYSTILFKVLPRETGGNMFVIEHAGLAKGGPDMHLHHAQEEYFFVLDGQVLFQVGETQKLLETGDSIVAPRGVPHCFAARGQKPSRMLIAFSPAGKMEAFLRDTTGMPQAQITPEMWARYDLKYIGPSPLDA